MLIGFLGDMHGSAFHALALIYRWMIHYRRRLDYIIQPGDIGILPNPDADKPPEERFYQWNKTVYDLFYLAKASGKSATTLRQVRETIGSTVLFIRGNHDEQPQFQRYKEADHGNGVPIDPYGLFTYMPDGAVLTADGKSILLFGDPSANSEIEPSNDRIDILVTHQGPYGIGRNTVGEIQGDSTAIALAKKKCPSIHVFGHHHHMIGPITAAGITYIGVNSLFYVYRDGRLPVVQPGSLMILDTDTMNTEFVTDKRVIGIPARLGIEKIMDIDA